MEIQAESFCQPNKNKRVIPFLLYIEISFSFEQTRALKIKIFLQTEPQKVRYSLINDISSKGPKEKKKGPSPHQSGGDDKKLLKTV